MRLGPEWKCGKCGKTYTFDEFIKLQNINYQSDKIPVCECGYRFLLDRWRFNDILKINIDGKDRDVRVSTVDLELNHGWGERDLWYETMIFIDDDEEDKDDIECYYENRYETKEEAINDHNRVVNLLKEGKFEIEQSNDKKILNLKE